MKRHSSIHESHSTDAALQPLSLELFSEALWQQDPTDVARLGMEKMQAYFAA